MEFKLHAPYEPTGDQPQAIKALVDGFKEGNQFETLLGVTGSGKTFTMANVIAALNKPTLIISHNKTLAGQLYSEFKEFFPENAVEYFVSYYDYYQPEALSLIHIQMCIRDRLYTKDNLPEKATRTWVTKTVVEKDNNGNIHYVTKLADAYKVSGDAFYTQNEKNVLPLGTLTVEETKAPDGYLLDGAYMQAGDSTEQIKGMYLTQITEDGELAVLSGSNQYSVSDQIIRGGVKIQKRDLETKDTKAQGSATLKDAAFAIISLNENSVLVEGKLYKKNETVKTIQTGNDGIATTSADLLPYGKYKLEETKAPEGYLTDGAKAIEFSITENGKIVDLTDESHSIYNQIKRGDLEGVKIGAGTHKRLANVPFKITSKTTGESHIVVTDKNGQFSTATDWASHKKNTNAGKSSEDGIWFGTSVHIHNHSSLRCLRYPSA